MSNSYCYCVDDDIVVDALFRVFVPLLKKIARDARLFNKLLIVTWRRQNKGPVTAVTRISPFNFLRYAKNHKRIIFWTDASRILRDLHWHKKILVSKSGWTKSILKNTASKKHY